VRKPEPTEELKLARMSEVWRMLVSHGVCDCCASAYALVVVEREMGDPAFRPWPLRCKKLSRRGETCRAITADAMEAALWESVTHLLTEAMERRMRPATGKGGKP